MAARRAQVIAEVYGLLVEVQWAAQDFTSPATFTGEPTKQEKYVDAMKKGSDLKASATSERGTPITDSYSLSGLGQAMAKLQAECF